MNSAAPDLSIIIPSYNEELRLPATLARIWANHFQNDWPNPLVAAVWRSAVRFQGVPARAVRHHLRTAEDRTIRVPPGTAIPGAAPWIACDGDTRALGAFASHESKYAARQHPDVHRRVHDPVEFTAGPLSAQSVNGFTLPYKVLDIPERLG